MALFGTLNGILGAGGLLATITGNTSFVFSSATVSENIARTIDENTIIIAYRDGSPATAQILDISGGTVTGNTSLDIEPSLSAADMSLALLSPTKAIVIYRNSGSARTKVLTISGSSITAGSRFVYAGNAQGNVIEKLTSSKAIVVYVDFSDSNKGKAQVLDISGTSVTGNTVFAFDSNSVNNIGFVALSSTKAIVVYSNSANNGTAQILDISGGTVTGNTKFTFDSSSTGGTSVAFIDVNTVIVCYKASDLKGTAQILNISGGTVTGNTKFTFETGSLGEIALVQVINESTAIVTYTNESNSKFGTAQILNISGGTITGNTTFVYESANTNHIALQILNSNKAIVCYQNLGSGNDGTAEVLDIK